MNEQTIQTIAEAILQNTRAILMLVEALPHEHRQQVAVAVQAPQQAQAMQQIAQPVPAPAPQPAPAPAPAPAPQPAQVVQMPAPPMFQTVQPTAAPAPAQAAPFTTPQQMMQYVMDAYKQMGPQKGSQIQGVMTNLGYSNINDIKPEHYNALYNAIEEMKK